MTQYSSLNCLVTHAIHNPQIQLQLHSEQRLEITPISETILSLSSYILTTESLLTTNQFQNPKNTQQTKNGSTSKHVSPPHRLTVLWVLEFSESVVGWVYEMWTFQVQLVRGYLS
jgi:hypothetical protein